MITFYIERHGQSTANVEHWFSGQTGNAVLTELGARQAAQTAKKLAQIPFCAIYTSDLVRARQTAEAHVTYHNVPFCLEKGLRELDVGTWGGLPVPELAQKPEYTTGWTDNYFRFALPGGETVRECAERIRNTLVSIARAHTEGDVVLISTHAAAIRSFWGLLIGAYEENFPANDLPFPSNASFSVVTYENGVFTPVFYSQNEHLLAENLQKFDTPLY